MLLKGQKVLTQGSVLNNLTMNVASFPFIACTLDTMWSEALKLSSHSVSNRLSSLSESNSGLKSGHKMSIIAS